MTMRNLIKSQNNNTYIESRTEGYEIPCLDCNKKYAEETSRSINKQIYEHKKEET